MESVIAQHLEQAFACILKEMFGHLVFDVGIVTWKGPSRSVLLLEQIADAIRLVWCPAMPALRIVQVDVTCLARD